MKPYIVVQINTSCGVGSTGKICVSISELLSKEEIDNYILYSSATSGYSKGISCCTKYYTKIQAIKSRLLGNYGFNSKSETQRMIFDLERISPEVVLIHNIHGHDCNLSILFSYFKNKHIKLFWTFHDCWAFTAYCTHFIYEGCEKWKTGCNNCEQRKKSSWLFDRSDELYRRKKDIFGGLDLTIITPSQWLADLVKQSFLKQYPIRVINNGIDLSVFKPTKSDFRERYHIKSDQCVLLGVAFNWGNRKGLDMFINLAERLDSNRYKIVLVGTNDDVDKTLPNNIISIHRTHDAKALAEIYTSADLFVNPTREDNFPTVNLEALACGTPVVTFKTGGSPECIDESCGFVVPLDDYDSLERTIINEMQERSISSEACMKRASLFDKNICFEKYVRLLTDF